ncbi:MAG: penicillin acylase family protein [Acidobacteria bacterium]|nr:penicillin acylase family protein [Acidobacteriota bacterium]
MKFRNYPVILLGIILIAAAAAGAQTTAKTISVKGLQKTVTVRRDARSIPYIEAASDADLYFAQGFVTASDRLWQMDFMRRVARGQLSELFGERVLEEDKRWRRMGFSGIAERSMATLDPGLRKALEDYARGVNAYIATLDKSTLPVEFRVLQYEPTPWMATDTLCIGKILAEGLSSTWQQDLIRASIGFLPADKLRDITNNTTPFDLVLYGKDKADAKTLTGGGNSVAAVPESLLKLAERDAELRKSSLERAGFYAEDLAASNNWVISGKRTADGKPLLANDPHLQPAAPNIWYLTHLSTPQNRVAGVTFPGVPGIVLGHNAFIAWGATNVGPDVQDLYRETFNDRGEYKTPAGWEKTIVRTELIKVRKNLLKPETETQTLTVEETRHGPLITDEVGQKWALKWTARDPENQEFEAFFKLNRARDWTEFENALKTYGGASQNFVYAAVKGNIGWYAAGKIPLRRTGDGSVPYDGATNEGDWTGYIPFGELPHLYNPPEGLIVTANQRTVGTDYKYYGIMTRDAANPWRARRIYELLKDRKNVTMDDVRDVQRDVFSRVYKDLADEIVKRGAASPETLAALGGWDGRMTADSKAGLIVNEIRMCVSKKIAEDSKIPEWVARERLLYWVVKENSARWLPKSFNNYAELLKSCDESARKSLSDPKRFGADETKWRWGAQFAANFQHPLALAPLIGEQFKMRFTNVDGSPLTPNVGPYVSMRLIADPGNWDATRHVIPLGESGDPQSPFWKDQFELWRTGTPAIFPFTKAAVEKSATDVTLLK